MGNIWIGLIIVSGKNTLYVLICRGLKTPVRQGLRHQTGHGQIHLIPAASRFHVNKHMVLIIVIRCTEAIKAHGPG